MMDTDPLSVILVKNGSKGDRLLFRYPFSTEARSEGLLKWKRSNPYALMAGEDLLQNPPPLSTNITLGSLTGFADQDLSTLLAVKPELCGSKFELKVNDIRFVGHPTLLPGSRSGGITSFVVAFALRATASHSIVRCYHHLSQQFGIALRHEERRCSYLTKQAKAMIAAYDEVTARPEDDAGVEPAFAAVLRQNDLACDLHSVYEDLCAAGVVQLRVNRWVLVSFCLPQKVHRGTPDCIIEPERVRVCLESLRPYHGLLLLGDSLDLPPDASPALRRLARAISPLKSLQTLADDAGLTLTHVFQLAGHLLYWAQAIVIYPLCESNIYTLSPEAPIHALAPLSEQFSERFPGYSLAPVLAEFSLPTPLGMRTNGLPTLHSEIIQVVMWLLEHRLLLQLHMYVYLCPRDQPLVLPSQPPPFPVKEDEVVQIMGRLTSEQRSAVMAIPAASNHEDLQLFNRLERYFDGQHHLEEMMYYENVRRSQLLQLLDKFRDVVLTWEGPDAAVECLRTHFY